MGGKLLRVGDGIPPLADPDITLRICEHVRHGPASRRRRASRIRSPRPRGTARRTRRATLAGERFRNGRRWSPRALASGEVRRADQRAFRGQRGASRQTCGRTESGLPHVPRRRGYWITMEPLVRLPVMLYPSVKTRVKTPGARLPLSTAIIVKPTGSPLFTPVPMMVTACRPSSAAKVAEVIVVDLKSVPEPGNALGTTVLIWLVKGRIRGRSHSRSANILLVRDERVAPSVPQAAAGAEEEQT